MSEDEHPARSARGAADGDRRSDDDSLAEFLSRHDSSSTVSSSLDAVASSVSRPLVKKPSEFQGKRLGSYEILELLGKGGIGLVFLAYDQRLTRRVALKLLKTDDPEAAHRLLDEARAQARVEHENVCQVYEAGEIDGQTYIAMQYIEGRPLTEAFRDMTLEERVRVIQRVAEGLQAAHDLNLIHRDVKPGNVLVERTPRGDWKPYILDFGLAREQAAPGETTTGEVKGTPSYMPPEQVTGQVHVLDARADVYSLGATFYEGMVGRQLFPESTGGLAVMLKVLNEDPEPLRAIDKSIPVDVESIVMRCLEKDPSRRYASARELADDLQRYLEGEPVSARTIGPVIRLWRRLKKRRVAALTVGLVATVVLSAALFAFVGLRARAKARFMEQYRQDVQYVDKLMDDAYGAPLHDITPEKNSVRKRLKEIRERLARQGKLAQGPGNFALGRGHLALHEYEDAYRHLEIAWERGTQDPEVGYSLGRALGALYEKELQVARRIDEDSQREERLREIEELYREPALRFLRRSDGIDVDEAEIVEALIALWEGRYAEALDKAQAVYRSLPWFYEALALQGDVYVAVGEAHDSHGEYDEARDAYRQAQEVYAAAAEKGRSDARIYEGQCSLAFALMRLDHYGLRRSPEASFRYGLEACERARRVDPERAEPYELESMLNWRMGDYEVTAGIDPTGHLTHAADTARQALKIEPDHVETYASLGFSEALLAQWQLDRGLDPRTAAERALEAFREGIRLDPQYARCHNGLGYTHWQLAQWEIEHGEDPGTSLNAAFASLERAVVLEKEYFFALDNLGNTYIARATWELLRGIDPGASVEGAVDAFTRIEEQVNPKYFWAVYGIGDAWSHLAQHQIRQGEDPSGSFEKARAAFERARAIDPDEAWVFFGTGRLAAFEGRWQALRGGDPEKTFRSARENLEQGIKLLPEETWGYQSMAELDLYRARWKLEKGRSPASDVDHGLTMTARALELDSGLAEVVAIRGALEAVLAEADRDRGERLRHRGKARSDLERALEMNSNLSDKYRPVFERLNSLDSS